MCRSSNSKFLLTLFMVFIFIVFLISLSLTTPRVEYGRITIVNIEFALSISSFVCTLIFALILVVRSQGSSISFIIAQRFGIVEYLSVYVIMISAMTTMSLSSTASVPLNGFNGYTNLEHNALILCYLGPLLASGIIIFPLIVDVDAKSLKLHENILVDDQPIEPIVGKKITILLHTRNRLVAKILHYLFVGTGYLLMSIGGLIINNKVENATNASYLVVWIFSVISISIFVLLGLIESVLEMCNNQLDAQTKQRIDPICVFTEYLGLSLMLLCISLNMSKLIGLI